MGQGIDLIQYLKDTDMEIKSVTSTGETGFKRTGAATVFNDSLNTSSSFTVEGDRAPIMKYFANDGVGGTDNARSFNGTSDYGTIPTGSMNPTHASVNIWVNPDDLEGQLIYIPGLLDFYFSGGTIVADWVDIYTQQSSVAVSQNAWSMITITAEDIGTKVTMKMYINGVLNKAIDRTGNLQQADSGDILIAKYTSGWFNKAILDELTVFDEAISQGDIDNLYNNGVPTGIIDPAIIGSMTNHFKFNEASGTSTVTNEVSGGDPITLNTTVAVVAGAVGDTGSKGVAAPHWGANTITEVHLSSQLTHARKLFTDLIEHYHVFKTVDASGWICMALEFIAVTPGGIIGNTTTIRGYINAVGDELFHQHCITGMNEVIDGSGLNLSSSIVGRLYRDTEWEDDNDGQQVADYVTGSGTVLFAKYNHDVVILASDSHIELDDDGSELEYTKEA